MIWGLQLNQGLRLIRKAMEEKAEARMWALYCSVFPNFTSKNKMSFEEFYKKPTAHKKSSKKTTDTEMDRFSDIADLHMHRSTE